MGHRRALSNKIAPDYAGLSGVVFHHRAEGLVTNTTNAAGVVDVSGNVTRIISMSPHVTGNQFDSVGTAPTLSAGTIVYGGAGNHRHNGASTVFNNFHNRASKSLLKWAIHGVMKVGTGSDPNALYSLFGNSAGSDTSKGIFLYYDDRVSSSVNNSFGFSIVRGVVSSAIAIGGNTNIITPNRFLDFWIQYDGSLDQEYQILLIINGFRFIVFNRWTSTTLGSTPPTYAMEIAAAGNAVARGVLTLKEITFQDALNTDAFRQAFITSRMFKYNISGFPFSVDGITLSSQWNQYDTLDDGKYYLMNVIHQNPTDSNMLVSIFSENNTHFWSSVMRVVRRISLDKGRTWSSKTAVYADATDPTNDSCSGYDSTGRLHFIFSTHTAATAPSTNKLLYAYSDDDGVTLSTLTNITSVLSSLLSMASFAAYSRMIENNGVLMCVIYRFTEQGDGSNSSRSLLRSTDNGANWTEIVIQSGATVRTETCIIGLSSTVLLVVTRDDSTLEWYQSMSTDNGATWTNQGALNFGEALVSAGPVRLRKFQISGTDIIACYFPDRAYDTFKVVYAKASSLIASGISGWTASTKFTIHQGSNDKHLHYGDVCHYDNGFEAIGQYVIDPFPSTGAGTENIMFTFDIPTFHYEFVKTGLGL